MLIVESGNVLLSAEWSSEELVISDGRFAGGSSPKGNHDRFDASGLLVLPGIVDFHGDAFERQIMPRPGVFFDIKAALRDTDRQLTANGITTAFHALTCSWEPGLRGVETARGFIAALRATRGELVADTRFHLRHETFNLDCEAEVAGWLREGIVDVFSFNDHMNGIVHGGVVKASKIKGMIERSGLGAEAFTRLVEQTAARANEVHASIARLAETAHTMGVPMMSHDDRHVSDREDFRALGCAISEFPMNEETAAAAVAAGEFTVFGAPNVVRGGSHTGCPSAADMVGKGLCSILASDYYYPALLAAPFILSARRICRLAQSWALVSQNPARALGLKDRGSIAPGLRADAVLVDATSDAPRLVATIVAGKIVWLADIRRYQSRGLERHVKAGAIALES